MEEAQSAIESLSSIKEDIISDSSRLYLIFGGIAEGIYIPPFEFCRASNILESNRLFIRDFNQSWYHHGLKGISTNIIETLKYLKGYISNNNYSDIILVGNSMGGYAALLFGSMIPNSRVIAFAPQTYVNPCKRIIHRDFRWRSKIRRMYLSTVFKPKFFDLSSVLATNQCKSIRIIVSENKLDLSHAANVAGAPNLSIEKIVGDDHGIVRVLRDQGRLAELLT